MPIRTLLCTLGACAGLAAGLPASAAADSIVYLKDGNVWIANPDGSGARQFTLNTYHWAWPSEADDGTVVAAGGDGHGPYGDAGSDIYRFSADGNQIGGAIPTAGTYYSLDCPTTAPWSVRVSPDASKIAYSTVLCSTRDFTTLWTPSTATGLDFPNQNNGVGDQDYEQPAWIDSSHYVASHAGQTVYSGQSRWYVQDTTQSPYGTGWTEDTMSGTGAQGLVSRPGTTFAVFEDDAADYTDGQPRNVTVWLYRTDSLTTALTTGWGDVKCKAVLDATHTTNPFRLSPSFSPDGSKLLWADDQGVEVASVADLTADGGGHCTAVVPHLLIPGASQPFYGKGNVTPQAAQPTQPGAPVQQPSTQTSDGATTQQTTNTTTNTTGNTDSNTNDVQPNPVLTPIARLRIAPRHLRARHRITFDARRSFESGGAIVAWTWTFGDGRHARGRLVHHTYRRPGRYRVKLTVRDAKGKTARRTVTIRVRR